MDVLDNKIGSDVLDVTGFPDREIVRVGMRRGG